MRNLSWKNKGLDAVVFELIGLLRSADKVATEGGLALYDVGCLLRRNLIICQKFFISLFKVPAATYAAVNMKPVLSEILEGSRTAESGGGAAVDVGTQS